MSNTTAASLREREQAWKRFHEWERQQSVPSGVEQRIAWYDSALRLSKQFQSETEAAAVESKVAYINAVRRKLAALRSPHVGS